MLKVGQRVTVLSNIEWNKGYVLDKAGQTFIIDLGMMKFSGKTVTIYDKSSYKKDKEGNPMYYYRIKEDNTEHAWIEQMFEMKEIKDFYLVRLKDDKFIVIQKESVIDIVQLKEFKSLTEEVQSNCTVY